MVSSNKARLFYVLASLVVVFDQVTKAIARSALSDGHRAVTVLPGLLKLELASNTGAAFGLAPGWVPLFAVVTLVAIFAIVRLRRSALQPIVLTVGLAMVLGGAVGNLIDRLLLPGHAVTDFLAVYFHGKQVWPTFNIADAAVVVGAILMFFYVYIVERGRVEPAEDAPRA